MIDFRYHLVSLVAVFLALALGIVLGAGPLRESLGEQLTGQVEQLRTEKDDLRAANSALTEQSSRQAQFIADSGQQLVSGTMPQGTRVALITDHDNLQAAHDTTAELIHDAGGTVAGTITISPAIGDPSGEPKRAEALDALRAAVPGLDLSDPNSGAALIHALHQSLDPASTLTPQQRAAVQNTLNASGLITTRAVIDQPVDAVVLMVSPASDHAVRTDSAEQAADRAQRLDTIQARFVDDASATGLSLVLAGPSSNANESAGIIRTQRSATGERSASTVDDLTSAAGPVITALAVAEQLNGGRGDYGTAPDASAPLPDASALRRAAAEGGRE